MHNQSKKKKIAFFLFSNLKTGTGTENVVREYSLKCPESISLTIIQTQFLDRQRMSEEVYSEIAKSAKIITLGGSLGRIESLLQTPKLGAGPFAFIIHLLSLKLFGIIRYKALKKLFSEFDLVYLLSNRLSFIIPRGPKIVGSEHSDLIFHGKSKILNELIIKFIGTRFLYKRISGFHIFPGTANEMPNLHRKLNFVLPPRGLEISLFRPKERYGKPKFLFVSRLIECKGIRFVIDLWKNNSFDADLHIVGDGFLSDLAVKASEINNVYYQGKLDPVKLLELYETCDVFLTPSTCDTFSTVTMEALTAGCYVIMSPTILSNFSEFVSANVAEAVEIDENLWTKRIQYCILNLGTIRDNSSISRAIARNNFDSNIISEIFFKNLLEFL